MIRFFRLVRYGMPYWLEWLPGVLLLAVVGFLDALRMALFVPILGVVLKPESPSNALVLFPTLPARWQFDVHHLIPPLFHVHNVLTVVAIALVGSTILKGICDYAGTYLVNYAGFGMMTDLRNHAAFPTDHPAHVVVLHLMQQFLVVGALRDAALLGVAELRAVAV